MGCNVSYIYSKIYIVGRGGLVIENSLLDQMVLGLNPRPATTFLKQEIKHSFLHLHVTLVYKWLIISAMSQFEGTCPSG